MRMHTPIISLVFDHNHEPHRCFCQNDNANCIYYVNHRLMKMPGYIGANDYGWHEQKNTILEVAELVECLPGVYTRVLKTALDTSKDLADKADLDLGIVDPLSYRDPAYEWLCGIAFLFNSWNAFRLTGETRIYSRDEPQESRAPENCCDIAKISLYDSHGREAVATAYGMKHEDDFDSLIAVAFNYASEGKEAEDGK